MGCHFLLQGILLTLGLNPCLPHWQADSLPLTHEESPKEIILRNYQASLVAQTVKRLLAMRETRIQPLDLEDTLEKEVATHSSILAWEIP